MPLSSSQQLRITTLLREKIQRKLAIYGRETTFMPFLARLIQDHEKIAAYSFIHSLATTLGMSVYEEVSVIVASEHSQEVFRRYGVGGVLSEAQKTAINHIVVELRNGSRVADIKCETQEVLAASPSGGQFQKSGDIADLFIKRDGQEYLFEIKTVKPNIDNFEKSKTKLLEWVARKRSAIKPYLAFPYNPYHPEPYTRFTECGIMDRPHDFLIGDEYWNFLGGPNTYEDLLAVFDQVGQCFRAEMHDKFRSLAAKQYGRN